MNTLLLLLAVVAQDPPPLVAIYELDAKTGARVEKIIAPLAREGGFEVAVLTGSIQKPEDFDAWLKKLDRRFDPKRVFLFGFSAAGPGALEIGLRCSDRLKGLILAAGLVDAPDETLLKQAHRKFPVLLLYSEGDTTAPPARGAAARKALEKAGLSVTWEQIAKEDHLGVLQSGVFYKWAAGLK